MELSLSETQKKTQLILFCTCPIGSRKPVLLCNYLLISDDFNRLTYYCSILSVIVVPFQLERKDPVITYGEASLI